MSIQLIEKVKTLMSSNLVSAVEFGSEGQPNNLMLVFNKLDFEVLNKIKPLIIEHKKKSNTLPLLFTAEELQDGADVFPLEFLDIKFPHKTLYGKEVVDTIKFDKKSVRRQLEFELRSKLIHLRESYIWIKNSQELKELLSSAVPTLMPLFYGLLFLKSIAAPSDLDGLFNRVSQEYKINLGALKDIKHIKEGTLKANDEKLDECVKKLMVLLSSLGEAVDEMKV